jgi:hypothetical protein
MAEASPAWRRVVRTSSWAKTTAIGGGRAWPGGNGASFEQRWRVASDRESDAALGHGGWNGGEAGEASDRGVGAGARGEARRGRRQTATVRFGHGMAVGAGF